MQNRAKSPVIPQDVGLLLLDLDGTLAQGRKVSERNLEALRAARGMGCLVATATGRPYQMIPQALKDPQVMDYHVCANGGLVCDALGAPLLEQPIPFEKAIETMDALRPLGAGWNAFTPSRALFEWRSFSYMLAGRRDPRAATVMRVGKGRRAIRTLSRMAKRFLLEQGAIRQVFSLRGYLKRTGESPYKMGCSFRSTELADHAEQVLKNLGGLEVIRMSGAEFELTLAGVDKGASSLWLEGLVEVPKRRTVAFGDSQNDMTLRAACGTLVAMDNATPDFIEIADETCEGVDDDGVARWLERAMDSRLSEVEGLAET